MSPPSPTPSPITASLLASHTLPQLKFLYSSLSPRALSNPTGYRSAINSWREILTDLVGKGLLGGGGRLGVEVGEAIVEELRVDGVGRPGGLGGVLVELELEKAIVRIEEYEAFLSSISTASTTSISWTSLLVKPLWWSFSRLGLVGSSPEVLDEEKAFKDRKGFWVVTSLVEKMVVRVLPKLREVHSEPLERVYNYKSFEDRVNGFEGGEGVGEKDCVALVEWLKAKGECSVGVVDNIKLIKFRSLTTPVLPPTTVDLSTLTLLLSLQSLTQSLVSLALTHQTQSDLVQTFLKKLGKEGKERDRGSLKREFGRLKRLEKLVEEREGARERVEELIEGIRKARGNEETLAAITLGTTTLKSILTSSKSLTIDNVDKVMDGMKEVLEEAGEIDGAVKDGLLGGVVVDEDELEREFEGMVEEERREEMEKEERRERERVEQEGRKLEESGRVLVAEKGEEKEAVSA